MPMGTNVHAQLIHFTCRICPLPTSISYLRNYSGIFVANLFGKGMDQSNLAILFLLMVLLIKSADVLARSNPCTVLHGLHAVNLCSQFSKTCIEVSGLSAKDVAKQLKVNIVDILHSQYMVSSLTTCSLSVIWVIRS